MTFVRPFIMQPADGDSPITVPASAIRDTLAGLWVAEGVTGPATALKIRQRGAGANFTVEADPGWAVIQGDDATDQGLYVCRSNAVAALTVPAAPGSGSRTHRVVARVKDKKHSGSYSTYEWLLELLADTGSGTPAVPDSAIPIARIGPVVPSTAAIINGLITDDRAYASTFGGIVVVASQAARDALSPYTGMKVYRLDLDTFQWWNGSEWRDEQSPNRCSLVWTSSPTITDDTNTRVTWTSADYEIGADYWASSPNPSRLVIPRPGLWEVSVCTQFDTDSSGRRAFEVKKNAGGVFANGTSVMLGRAAAVPGATTIVQRTRKTVLAANDHLEVWVYQNSGGGLQAGLGSTNNYIQATYIGPSS